MEEPKKISPRLFVRIFAGAACVAFVAALLFLLCTLVREERETRRLLSAAFGGVKPEQSTVLPPESTQDTPAGGGAPSVDSPLTVGIVSVDLAPKEPQINNATSYGIDLQALADRILLYHAGGKDPLVLILHSHPDECYTPVGADSVPESFGYTSDNRKETVFAVGEAMADVLRATGIGVIHADDRDGDAAAIVKKYRQVYPSLTYVLDLHRDGIATSDGRIVRSQGSIAGVPAAQLMLAVGTDLPAGGRSGWQSDLAGAYGLCLLLAQKEAGLMRATLLRPESLGQGGAPCQWNLYVGTTGNTLEEAIASARFFAKYYAVFILTHTAY